ncbi:hypothetical protein DRW07_06915 [Alteromonas sediminis]|uniref:Energy-coupling factor ABC transporter permease n=1 Tax=Alteromonas sediminis TaxID=2259342 RepID=A0A3N5Y8A9_9ALTE|nr:energy-coupling factor ABC transporter permease [Alteromonas sediminis]RPJ67259.1 hypothetical protein DRW07_06915 [Alteromonas sediminis]
MTLLQIATLAGFCGLLFYISRHLPLHDLLQNNRQQHLVFGCAAAVFTLWLFRAGIYEGLSVHFLWLPALALTLGLRWGIICATMALLGVTAVGIESWSMFGVNGLLGIVLPMSLSYLVLMLAFHKLPRHLFVYIFICAFFPGALGIASKMFFLTGYYTLDGLYTWQVAFDNYLILTPLMLFPEAMLNGMTMTLLVIYKPDWVYTFHDKFYLDK